MTTPKHFAKFRKQEVVVVGYQPSMNECLIAILGNLPQDEATHLRNLAMTTTAQGVDFLAPLLENELHKSRDSWMGHLVLRLKRGDGAVLRVSIKELDDMNQDQKSFWKGNGTWVPQYNSRGVQIGRSWVRSDSKAANPDEHPTVDPALLGGSTTSGDMRAVLHEDASLEAETRRVAAQTAGPATPVDPNMAALMAQLVQGQQEMAAAVSKLADKVKKPRATTRKRKTKAKPAGKSAAAQNV